MQQISIPIHLIAAIGLATSLATMESTAQSRRAPELRSCMTSEMALIMVEKADYTKSLEENKEIGRKFGYVVAQFYKKAIWAMDDPETEGRDVVLYAVEHSQTRMKYVNRAQLAKDVKDCRISFGN